ncbi:MAG: hypothetical protein ACP5US_11365 [Candidatus Kryptoniota bacterium]
MTYETKLSTSFTPDTAVLNTEKLRVISYDLQEKQAFVATAS